MRTHERSAAEGSAGSPDEPRRKSPGLKELAERLESIAGRAASEGWPAWTDEDALVTAVAAEEIRTIPDAMAAGMREAFAAGREYGHREERLDEINVEITALSTLLARQAWGGGGAGRA